MQDKQAIKEEIFRLVKEYSQLEEQEQRAYQEGDRIPYCTRVYDERERVFLVDSALEFWLTSGRYVEQFEDALRNYLDVAFAFAVNSGSSANLLAFMSLTSPLLGERRIKRGDEVITVAAAFPTTIAPIIQYGAIPVFVDITLPSYNIDVSQLEKALSKKTKAVMIAHTLGIPFQMKEVKEFCEQHGLWLIEDNCDALGAEIFLNGRWQKTGSIGDIGTSSFYPAHHITTGEGGAVYTANELLAKIIRSMRDWGRDCVCPSGQDNFCQHRFDGQFGKLPRGYDHKYVYSHWGYNLKMTEMQAAIGCAQLEKLPEFVRRRRKNWQFLREKLADIEEFLLLPQEEKEYKMSPFGFLCLLKEETKKSRNELVKELEEAGIQTRNLFSGNILLHPCFEELAADEDYRVCGTLEQTNRVMNQAFWIGVYPKLQQEQLVWMAKWIRKGIEGIT